nr:sulfatase-like hydrolase/transferase [Candidatus Sigynarchaeota archaeon]
MARKPNFLFLIPDQHRGDFLPYSGSVLETLGMKKKLDIRVPNIAQLMVRGVTFYRCISPAPVCAPARACLATGLNYARCECRDNSENTPISKTTFYHVLRDAGYAVGGVGKFDLHKGDHEWGIDGWHPKLDAYGFSRAFSIDNGGKSAAHSAALSKLVDGKRVRIKDPKDARPAEPYMKFLESRGLMGVHLQDFSNRGGLFGHLITQTTPLPDDAYCDNWVGQNAIDMIKKFPRDKPWFLQVNWVGPHPPWDVTTKMRATVEDRDFPPPIGSDADMVDELVDVRRNYAASIENIDRNAGLILSEVEKRGEMDNTIVIYSSDHGEMLGDRGEWGKSLPWRGSVSVPLVLAGSGIQHGKTSSALVELQDIASTIIDIAGLSMPGAKDSVSLRPLLEARGKEPSHRKVQCASLFDRKAYRSFVTVSDGIFKLVQVMDKVQVFDLAHDPWEMRDVTPDRPEIAQDLLHKLDTGLSAQFANHLHEAGAKGTGRDASGAEQEDDFD